MSYVNATEQHYTAAEIGEMWHLDTETVRDIFINEEGVLKFGRTGTSRRRGYTSLRIPQSVMERVHTRMLRK